MARRNRLAELMILDALEGGEAPVRRLADLLCPDLVTRRTLSRVLRRLLLSGRIRRVRRGVYRLASGHAVQVNGSGVGLMWLPEEGVLVIQTRRPRASVLLERQKLPPLALEILRSFATPRGR